jgi:hypothetical protein
LRRPSLRSQLNQIRLWVRQGRTDAWIAHKLDISVEQLEQFKRDHRLDGEPAPAPAPEPVVVGEDVFEPEDETEDDDLGRFEDEPEPEPEVAELEETRRRRRGRRGGRRRAGRKPTYEATFDHGDEGYGLWLDPAVVENDVYLEHWAGHRDVTVTFDSDTITIRRSGNDSTDRAR